MNFENTYARLPARFYERVQPAQVPEPSLLAWNEELAEELGLGGLAPYQRVGIFSGNTVPAGAEPIALAYAGHQFGNLVPKLGDGRAVLLGEMVARISGVRMDLQLKGSGRTPFSRGGDGKSALGPVIREYLVSEAMHQLGVPTTRSLAAVRTGEVIMREAFVPGGVLTRVASSHIRIGTFQYFAIRGDTEAIRLLTDYAIDRHYPQVRDAQYPVLAFFGEVVKAQARLIAQWLSLGFIHGVMNTDNMSISGETIDYGPCAFLDEFDVDKVFSSIDRRGRYAYGRQSGIAQWNLARLAECLLCLQRDAEAFTGALDQFQSVFDAHYLPLMRAKLGLTGADDEDDALIGAWLRHLQQEQLDYTASFSALGRRLGDDPAEGAVAKHRFGDFERRWRQRVQAQPGGVTRASELMKAANPMVIPRNHQIERAIRASLAGDDSVFHELHAALRDPWHLPADLAAYAEPPLPEQRVTETFCGT